MTTDDHIEIKFPKGKLKAKHVAIVIVFAIFIYFLTDSLKQVLTTRFDDPNHAIMVIALILVLIGIVAVYIIRTLSKDA